VPISRSILLKRLSELDAQLLRLRTEAAQLQRAAKTKETTSALRMNGQAISIAEQSRLYIATELAAECA
jgi:hypothetical protein